MVISLAAVADVQALDVNVQNQLVAIASQNKDLFLEPENKLAVKQSWASEKYAYVCSLIEEGRTFRRTDDQYELLHLFFQKQNAKWVLAAKKDAFAKRTTAQECLSLGVITDDAIAGEITKSKKAAAAMEQQLKCVQLNQQGQQASGFHPVAHGKVIGAGRALLHTAPTSECANGLHIVNGDRLTVYTPFEGWLYVMYVNPKTGVDVLAWVKEDRVQFE